MAEQDFYELLGVDRQVSEGDLKKAYRKMAMQYHPDRNQDNPEAEAKFKEISVAYDVLSDAEKRDAYDRYGHAAFQNSGGAGGFEGGFGSSFADVFDDLFGEFMGGGRQQRGGNNRGSDLRYNMDITLEEAFNGKAAKITIPTTSMCDGCEGTGAEAGSQPSTCATCQGHGKVRAQSGFFTIERTCPNCGGVGRVISNPCKSCSGAGRVEKDKTLSVNIPKGVEDGTRIRLSGEGEAGLRGGPAGDLYIFLALQPHEFFQREAANIYCRVPITMTTAALGGDIDVPTLDGGRVAVSLPEGTQTGRQFRLRGKGMPHMRGRGQGDMYVQTMVETPVNLSKEQRALLEQFEESLGDGGTSPESEGFFKKAKELWNDITE
ncbi:MAG: molecular chaperone DnaJ [Rhodospirillaceae bacterium]|jgi:molecular chaperone DnaJ|nr:molecular chaperone DnaJ [Rhodospirillaceae bacterium]MBT5081375.1 molecular chaperone DnaJ [Rhodospirillaceae bacterium]MBT5522859.1 molecular chaperone DnaJ [Rhodospirillaceae bacterium]MBT5880906.1 molecular chaperone DnaJ [Rhodospirillaceae bacterium]MBT6591063.1 molecular chaperone DnaJ [Rhodospirillaceae bacterium]